MWLVDVSLRFFDQMRTQSFRIAQNENPNNRTRMMYEVLWNCRSITLGTTMQAFLSQ